MCCDPSIDPTEQVLTDAQVTYARFCFGDEVGDEVVGDAEVGDEVVGDVGDTPTDDYKHLNK